MRSLSSNYVSGANGNIRNVNVTIKDINDSVLYTASQILSVSIQKSITDGSVGIGFTQSDRLYLQVISDHKVPKMTWLRVYISIDGSPDVSFGRFVTEECVRDGSAITITAFDAMYYQSAKTVKFTGAPSLHLEPLSFPCSMQDMLDYICTLRNMTTEFTCQSFTVQQMPQKGGNQYYSVRELIGFIAACHGCNAKLDASNHLVFKQFETVNYSASAADVLDLTIDDSEPFEITGVLFTVDTETSIYIDDVPGSEYDEDDVGVISCYNPLATVEIAEYVWTQIGGLSYYGGSLTQRGKGIIEVGDVITVGNLKYPADTETYPLCVTSIDYSITADGGFVETLGSDAAKSSDQMSSGTNGSSGGAGGTGKFLDAGHTSVAHNDTEHNTSEGTYDSVDGYHNTITNTQYRNSKGNTVSGEENTLSGCTDNIVSGLHNTLTVCDWSVITGCNNRYSNCHDIFALDNGGAYVNNAHEALIIGGIYGGSYEGQSYPTGGELSNSIVCCDSAKIQGRTTNAIIVGNSHTIGSDGAFASAVFGQEHILSNPNSSLIAGRHNTVSAWKSIVSGEDHIVSTGLSAVFGEGHLVTNQYATVIGHYGEATDGSTYFAIGNGWSTSSQTQRANVFTVDLNGNVLAAGTYGTMGADYAEYFEWADGNPDNEDRCGLLVSLDGDRIVPAQGDDILGAVSGSPSVAGGDCIFWKGRYVRDIYGRIVTGSDGEPVVSKSFDPSEKYVPRSQRPEWDAVGLVGRLIVRDNGKCAVGGQVSARNGIAVPTNVRTGVRVLKRVDEAHIEVLIK